MKAETPPAVKRREEERGAPSPAFTGMLGNQKRVPRSGFLFIFRC